MNRNAVKYQPFKPLEGHDEALREKERKLDIVEKPILSEDDCERVNSVLCEILNEDLIGRFFVFKKDKIIIVESRVRKLSNGYLHLDDDILLLTDITNIEKI